LEQAMSDAQPLLVQEDDEVTIDLEPEHAWMLEETDRRIGAPYEYVVAAEALVFVRRTLRAIAAKHESEIKATYAAHKAATAAKRAGESKLPLAEERLAEQCAHYLRAFGLDSDSLVPIDQVPAVEGFGYGVRYRPVVRDLMKTVRAVARGRLPLEALTVNHTWHKEKVTALREAFSAPGLGYERFVVPMVTEPERAPE
jgi:hypothetical protein